MIVIGLDGADFNFIRRNLDFLPYFRLLNNKFGINRLECDVQSTSPHGAISSASSWATICTGLPVRDHKIVDYFLDRDAKPRTNIRREDCPKFDFIWEKLDRRGIKSIAFNVPVFLPPIFFKVPNPAYTRYQDSKDGMIKRSENISVISQAILFRFSPRFFMAVFPELDRAQHLNFGNTKELIDHYNNVGRWIQPLTGNGDDFLIVSDHGFVNLETAIANEWVEEKEKELKFMKGHHGPDAICCTSLKRNPKCLSDIYPMIMKNFEERTK